MIRNHDTMTLSKEQTEALLRSVADTQSDDLDCDDCFQSMAEFIEIELAGRDIPDAMLTVKRHLEQCPCCNDEHKALLTALRSLNDHEN